MNVFPLYTSFLEALLIQHHCLGDGSQEDVSWHKMVLKSIIYFLSSYNLSVVETWEDCKIRQALGLLWERSVQTVRYKGLRHIIRKSEQETVMSGIPNPVQTVTSDSAQKSNLAKNVNGFLALTNPLARQMISRTTGRVHIHTHPSPPTQSQLLAWPYY